MPTQLVIRERVSKLVPPSSRTTGDAGSVAVGVGDFDHNGVSDIMWRDTSTSQIDNWLLAFS